MALPSSFRTYGLLLVLGVALVWIALSSGGLETNTVHQYTAYEVDHADGELTLTDAATGDELDRQAEDVRFDDRIACLPAVGRQCSFERQALEGEISARGIRSRYRFVHADGEFYRLRNVNMTEYEHERTDPADVFAELAIDSRRLTDAERESIDEGEVVTSNPFPHTNRLVRHDGSYYTILPTAHKAYSDGGGSFCSSSGRGFCSDADRHRWGVRLRAAGLGLLGALGIGVGGRGLLGAWRAERDE